MPLKLRKTTRIYRALVGLIFRPLSYVAYYVAYYVTRSLLRSFLRSLLRGLLYRLFLAFVVLKAEG